MTKPNTFAHEIDVAIAPTGFREYDARWLYPDQINLNGVRTLGQALAQLLHEKGVPPRIVVGHDYRSYSNAIKHALMTGLMAGGVEVLDIGLALSPMAYFAQFHLDCPSVAMVTASHSENGWNGVKMGCARPLTFGPDEMARLRDIALAGKFLNTGGGRYTFVPGVRDAYIRDLTKEGRLSRPIKAVLACGNGTAGAFAPEVFKALGCEIVEMDCALDYTFPNYNPNPEDMEMLHALADRVRQAGADVGLAFDGDGDRCGFVDDTGEEIFADKIGVLLARDLSSLHPGARFIADVKSTGLFMTDPVLASSGAQTEFWMTGHSHMKRRVHTTGALVGFEKSGHFFFNAPLGRGYDDGLLSGIAVCRMLDRAKGKRLSELKAGLPQTWISPTMSPFCPDETKYGVVAKITDLLKEIQAKNALVLGQKIVDVLTVNGVRVALEDGTWGLVRASSNKPSLVVVVESPVSALRMHEMFEYLESVLAQFPDIGEFDQKLQRPQAA